MGFLVALACLLKWQTAPWETVRLKGLGLLERESFRKKLNSGMRFLIRIELAFVPLEPWSLEDQLAFWDTLMVAVANFDPLVFVFSEESTKNSSSKRLLGFGVWTNRLFFV